MNVKSITIGDFTSQEEVNDLIDFLKQRERVGEVKVDDSAPEEQKEEGETKRKRSRGRSATKKDDAAEDKPKRGRGRGRGRANSAAQEDDGGKEEEAAPKRSRRATKKDDDDGEITNAQLTKAASAAARKIGTDGRRHVTALVHEFGVEDTASIPAEERQEFLDLLKGLVEEAEAGVDLDADD